MPKYVRPCVVDGVVVKDGKILLIKRKFNPWKGMWALPGGFIETNESAEHAVVREIMEETGYKVKVKTFTGYYDKPGRDPRHLIALVFRCEVVGGDLRSSNETHPAWFPLSKIPKLAADHKMLIKDAL